MGSVGDVSRVLLACVLHALGTNPAAVRGFRNRFPKPNFEMMSARFQTSVPSFSFFLVGSVGDVSRVLLACVLHALGTNPAAVRGFRNRFPKPNFEMMSARFQTSVPSFSFFLVGSVGDVSRVLLACVLHALGTNPAAVRGFRNRFPKPNFEMMSARFQTSVPGYSRIVSCDVGRPGGYLFSFLFFLFSGFRRRRFDSFIGLCFACLGHESCCCSRLSQPFSKAKFRDDVGAIPDERTVPGYSRIVSCDVGRPGGYLISFLFFLFSGFRRRRFESFIGLCFTCRGYTNPAAVRGFRNRFPKPNFEMMSARFQTSVPGYSRIVSCDVGRPGGYLFSFLFFLFSGFRRRRFDSFIGLCFACLGYESCCCSRLSQPFSKAKFRDDVGAIPDERTWL